MGVCLVALDREDACEPIGLSYIAAVLEQNEIPVDVLDFHYEKDVNSFSQKMRNGPALVGISCIGETRSYATATAFQAKKISQDVKTVIGGSGVYFMDHASFFKFYPEVDYLIRGEGEFATLELYKAITEDDDLHKVPNLIFRDGDEIVKNDVELIEDLNSLPFPKRRTKNRYSKKHFEVIASRGCNAPCKFCEYSYIHEKKIRRRTWENVFDEIESLPKTKKRKEIWLADEAFLPNAEGFLEEKKKRDLDFVFRADARLDYIVKYNELLQECTENGLYLIESGIESPSLNQNLGKGYGKETIKKAFKTVNSVWKNGTWLDHNYYGIEFTKDTTLQNIIDDCEFYIQLFTENSTAYLFSTSHVEDNAHLFNSLHISFGTPMFREYEKAGIKIVNRHIVYDNVKNVKDGVDEIISNGWNFPFTIRDYYQIGNRISEEDRFPFEYACITKDKGITNVLKKDGKFFSIRTNIHNTVESVLEEIHQRDWRELDKETFNSILEHVKFLQLLPLTQLRDYAKEELTGEKHAMSIEGINSVLEKSQKIVDELSKLPRKPTYELR